MPDVTKHRRVNDMLLGPLERPALQWLAERTPTRMTPDGLTIIGIIGSILVFIGYALSMYSAAFLWLASFGLVVNWYGDSMDGTLARYRKIERPRFGFFIDHTVDAFSQSLVFFGLGFSPYVRFDIAAVALVGYLLVSIVTYIQAYVTGTFRISYGGIGPTEMRVIGIVINTGIFFFGNPGFSLIGRDVSFFDLFVLFLAIAMIAVYGFMSISNLFRLADIDDKPRGE